MIDVRRRIGAIIAIGFLVAVAANGASPARADESEDVVVVAPVTPLLSARRFPNALQASSADAAVKGVLDSYLAKVTGTTCALVLDEGRIVYSRASDDTLAPASVQKLLTATAALEVLGPTTRLATVMVAEKEAENGVIAGDLFLIGGGDPLLTTAGYRSSLDNPNQFSEDFTAVADALATAGVKKVNGAIVGDDSRYENVRWLSSWPTRYQIGGTVGPLSALIVNDGQTGFTVSPDAPNPNRKAGDPTLLAAETFKAVLASRGIDVAGPSRTGKAPQDAVRIATFESATVAEIVDEMLSDSDNTTAELLTREIGFVSSGNGTTTAGLAAIFETASRLGIPVDDLKISDGSGLSLENRMSCTLALALITAAPKGSIVADALPLAGKTGTLRKRMLSTPATGRVWAKTGTLNTVNALAGFADTPSGNQLTFAFIHNGSDPRGSVVADGFADRLMGFAAGAKLASLGPLPTAQ
jgi:D-alanyl-D-alanine carboxypeptidase/D-alanyl-D-alanine-endopeptidase (penicillin-binding protein 4)